MVSVLFARQRSVYKDLGCDVWDADRDARLYLGSGPIIAHPPCRAWGRYAAKAKASAAEKELALWALTMVRCFGGVLEHPASSQLWKHLREEDHTVIVDQIWWGHRAQKRTRLFVSQVKLAAMPLKLDYPETNVENMGRAEREATPRDFAAWLVESCLTTSKEA